MKKYLFTPLFCLFAWLASVPTVALANGPIEDGVYYISCTKLEGFLGLGAYHNVDPYIYYVAYEEEKTDDAYWIITYTQSGYTFRNEATGQLLVFTTGRVDQYYKYMTLTSESWGDGSEYWNIIEGSDGAYSVQSTIASNYYWNLRNGTNMLGTYSGSNGGSDNERFLFHKKDGTLDPQGEHEWVDLGLPSGTLWATCNVGANSPEEYGDYFAWGEIKPKKSNGTWKDYSWGTYKWMNSGQADWTQINKYTFADNQTEACWYSNGTFIGDGRTVLLPEDDAATANWGSEWQMPSVEQIRELIDSENTTSTWTTMNGVNGRLVTSIRNNASIFLPAGGRRNGTESDWEGSYGFYWPNMTDRTYSDRACQFTLDVNSVSVVGSFDRYAGESIRPVRVKKAGEHEYVDLGLPSGTLWATCNVGASSPEEYGDYFAWGETEPKDTYRDRNYTYVLPSGETELDYSADAATANWGSDWIMPSAEQLDELINSAYTTTQWTKQNNVPGRKITSNINGNSIFLPAAGFRVMSETPINLDFDGHYWTRSLNTDDESNAHLLYFMSNEIRRMADLRSTGYTVRPVREKIQFPSDQYTAFTFPRALHVYLSDGRCEAYPLKFISSQSETNGQLIIETNDGQTFTYNLSEVDSVSTRRPDFPTFDSFKINKNLNDQVFGTVTGEIVEDTVFISLAAIGKRLTPTFMVSDFDAAVYVGGRLQESMENRLRFDKDIYYLVTNSNYTILTPDEYNNYYQGPYGRCVRVHVDWLTDRAEVPTIYINTADGGSITSKDYFKDATIIIDGHDIFPSMEETPVQIKGRGNTSWGWPKKPYRLKFAEKEKPLGMKKGKSWVLLSNYQTGSLMSNAIGMKAANLMGAAAANHIVPVDLYLNGEYRGSYNFTEKVGLSNNSVDIADESTAALLELDTYYDETFKFKSKPYNLPINIKEPDFNDTITVLTQQDVETSFNHFMEAVYNRGDISEYVDLEQLVRFMMVNELTLNYEFYHPKSTFCYRENFLDGESKYIFGPVWDLDWCFGYEQDRKYFQTRSTDNYWIDMPSMEARDFIRDLRWKYEPLNDLYIQLWEEFMENDLQELVEYCQDYYDFAKNSLELDYTKWYNYTDYAQQAKQAAQWLETRAETIYEDLLNDVRPYIPEPVEPVEFSNNKLYTITCERGDLVMSWDYTHLTTIQERNKYDYNIPDEDFQFAIITIGDLQYIYSPVTKQYLSYEDHGTWVSQLGTPITFDPNIPYGEYLYMMYCTDDYGQTLYFNHNTKTLVINTFDTPDPGNRFKIKEVGDFDPTEALELAAQDLFAVTNRYFWNGEELGSETRMLPYGATPPNPSSEWTNAFIGLEKPDNLPWQIEGETTIDYQIEWYGPFEFSTSFSDAYWYNMTIREDYFVGRQETEPYYPSEVDEETLLYDGNYFWAFGGNPYHVKVYNYVTGFGQTLSNDGGRAVMRPGDYEWDLLPNRDGFVLRVPGTDHACINQLLGSYDGWLGIWNDSDSPTDNGSTFRIFEANASDIKDVKDIKDHNDGIYNLAGQRVGEHFKGIVIKGGKKVLVK